MAVRHPRRGQVYICDFERGFVTPEMVKHRPVVVISAGERNRNGLCTVVPMSTKEPHQLSAWHHELSENPMPGGDPHLRTWVKADMIYTVSHARLKTPHIKHHDSREYITVKLKPEDMVAVCEAVKAYLAFEPEDGTQSVEEYLSDLKKAA